MIKKNLLNFCLVLSLSIITFFHFNGTSMLKGKGTSHWLGADIALATWVLERAQSKNSLTEFYEECRWSSQGCFRYDSVPMEWPFLYKLGKLGKLLGLDAMSSMDLWFYVTFIFNTIVIFISLLILTKDQWGAAAGTLPVVFQYSLAQKVAWGHLVLTFVAPIILSLTLCYKTLEGIKNKQKISKISILVIAICNFLTLYTSYYYTAFSFILHLFLMIIFVLIFGLRKNKVFLIETLKKVILPAAFGVFVSLLLNLHLFTGANGVHDGDINNRKPIGVSLYSARPMEFFKPLPDTVLGKIFGMFKISFANQTIRGEVYSYQGSAVVLSLFLILLVSLRKDSIKKIKSFFTSRSVELFFLLMAFVAMYFTTKFGGYAVYYTLTKSLRAFSRMAPFATFFLIIYLIFWSNSHLKNKKKYICYLLFFLLSVYESYYSEALLNLRSYTTSPLKIKIDEVIIKTDEQVSRLCAKGYLEMSPTFTQDFLNSQWVLQYFAEKHKCKTINGSYLPHFKNSDHILGQKISGKIQLSANSWDGADSLIVTEY